MKTFRLWVVATAKSIQTLKGRAAFAGVPFQQYLGMVLERAAEAPAFEVPEDSEDYPSAA